MRITQRHTRKSLLSTRGAPAAVLVQSALLVSCAATQPGPQANPEIFEPAGWFDIDRSLRGSSFDDYVTDVRQRLEKARLPFNPARAMVEIDRAAPVQLEPVAACGDAVNGIAILVHGLSDTAYAMYDMARYFASRCYVARTVLLPGHGTRAGDLLVTEHTDWTDTIRHLVKQAAAEHEHITLVGFSLGAVVTTSVALDDNSPVDALIAISPAFELSQWRLAKLTPYLHWLYKWIDRGPTADALRYEAMPTKAIAELVKALHAMKKRMRTVGELKMPWMLVQSLDDATIAPDQNRDFVLNSASDATVLEYYSLPLPEIDDLRVTRLNSTHDLPRVDALSHASVHIAPDNPHYGHEGEYRICGTVDGRDLSDAQRCEMAETVLYSVWARLPLARPEPAALSSFNPHFDELMMRMDTFMSTMPPVPTEVSSER